MSFNFTSNNQFLQVGVNHGNIYTRTDPISVAHSQGTPTPNVGGKIDSTTQVALSQALVKARRCLDMIQHAVSQNTQTAVAAERLSSLLLGIAKLDPEQCGSLEKGAITTVFSLLYCCIMECYELRPTPLAISSLGNQLDACNLALQCVYGAATMYVPDYLFDVDSLNSNKIGVLGIKVTGDRYPHSNRKSRRPSSKWTT